MSNYEKKNAPPNYIVRRVPRTNIKYLGIIDTYYYEPGTRKAFRSRKKAWERYHQTKNSENVKAIIIRDEVAPKITERQKKEVEEFLRDAWMNLMNKGDAGP